MDLRGKIKTHLVTSLLTSPITYIPHYHFALVDEILGELYNPKEGECKLLDLKKHSILEFDILRDRVLDFETKDVHEYHYEDKGLDKWIERIVYPLNRPLTNDENNPKICYFKNLFSSQSPLPASTLLNTALLDFAAEYKPEKGVSILIVDPLPTADLPDGIRDVVTVVEIPKPDDNDIKNEINEIIGENNQGISESCKDNEMKDSLIKELCRNLQGLELYEIKQILRAAMLQSNGRINRNTPDYVLDEKRRILQKSGIIEIIEPDKDFDKDIGGLSRLKKDIERAANLYKNLEVLYDEKMPLPKGILLFGMPGCGKSMIAKATANKFGVSLLRLDVSRLMGKYVGESEKNLRNALATAEAAHPCVLWIDEIEKAFSGAGSGNGGSDMLVMRMMGHFLTWMQERKTAVYIVATANDVLRSEFMRKGRFDQVYYVGFPDEDQRLDILNKKIERYRKSKHLKLVGLDNDKLKKIARKMENFAGAEIEYVVNEVMSNKINEYIVSNKNKEKISVGLDDFSKVIEDQEKSKMYQDEKEDRQESIVNIEELYRKYKFTEA